MHSHVDRTLGTKLFMQRVLRNPRQLGAVLPSSRHLCALLARHAFVDDDSPIIELGGGSGALTRALMEAGIRPSRIYVIELDLTLANYLKSALPGVTVIHGDAARLREILPADVLGKVRRVISGIPMINLPEAVRRKILESCFDIMAVDGAYLQYTYSPLSSINHKTYQLKKKRLGTSFFNLPPATVWQYTKE